MVTITWQTTGSALLACIACTLILGCTDGSTSYDSKADLSSAFSENDSIRILKASGDLRIKAMLPEFEKYVESVMESWKVPGIAVGIVQGDELVYARGFGVKKSGSNDPVTPGTVFQIGSASKAFTSALVAMQVDEGRVRWDDRVVDHLPEFRLHDPWVTREFTVEDLMAQRSGLPAYAGTDLIFLGYNRSYAMRSLASVEPQIGFRSEFGYQNIFYLWAAAVAERLTGRSWEDDIQEEIFDPLGMAGSSADMRSFRDAEDVAYLHCRLNGMTTPVSMDWKFMNTTYVLGPAGGINSNVLDMANWVIMQMNNGTFNGRQIISGESTRYMHSPKTILGPGANPGRAGESISGSDPYYCLGWVYEDYRPYPIIQHAGGTAGHTSQVAFVPQAKIGIVVLSNADISPAGEIAARFFDMYFGRSGIVPSSGVPDLLIGDAEQHEPSYQALPLDRYAGSYANDVYGRINVSERDGSLAATAASEDVEILLKPWERDVFLRIVPGMADYINGNKFASFQIGPDGRAESIKMDLLFENLHSGTSPIFRRVLAGP